MNLFSPNEDDEGSVKFLGAMICICTCALLAYLVGKSWWAFRSVGGIHAPYAPLLKEHKERMEQEEAAKAAKDKGESTDDEKTPGK